MADLPRSNFLPDAVRDVAHLNEPLPIGHGATSPQPWTVQFMLNLLHVQPGDKVLDVGSGSGWTTALLAHLVGPHGAVVGVELVPELVDFGRAHLPTAFSWAHIEQADPHTLGLPRGEPFQRILVSADAGSIPSELEDQLANGGRMVVPAASVMWIVDRDYHGLHREPVTGYRFAFAPLTRDRT